MRCPDEEMGRSSVKPCTTPSASACQLESASARSPTPAAASASASRKAAPAATMIPTRLIRPSIVCALVSRNEIILGLVTLVLVVFSLVVSIVVPRRNPGFPGKGLRPFLFVGIALVAGMLATVEIVAGEEGEEAEAAEVSEPPAAKPPAAEPAEPPAAAPPAAKPAPPAAPAGGPPPRQELFAPNRCG